MNLCVHWDHLSEDLPLERRSLVAEDESSKQMLLTFAGLGDPEPPVRPGQSPKLYRNAETPLTFSKLMSQKAISGAMQEFQHGPETELQAIAGQILESLDVLQLALGLDEC